MIRVIALLVAVSIPNAAAVASCDATSRKDATSHFEDRVAKITAKCAPPQADTNFRHFQSCIVPSSDRRYQTVLMSPLTQDHLLLVPKVPADALAPTGIESSDDILRGGHDNFWQQAVQALDFVRPAEKRGAPISIEINSCQCRTIDYLHAHIDYIGHDWKAITGLINDRGARLSNWVAAATSLNGQVDAPTYEIRKFDVSTPNVIDAALKSPTILIPETAAGKAEHEAGPAPAAIPPAAKTSLLAFRYRGAFYVLRTVYQRDGMGGHAEDLQLHDDPKKSDP